MFKYCTRLKKQLYKKSYFTSFERDNLDGEGSNLIKMNEKLLFQVYEETNECNLLERNLAEKEFLRTVISNNI